jgi:hypothetical protein
LPLSLLRLPGYSLLIIAAQDVFGSWWMEALTALQMSVMLYANFLVYRAAALFSRLWIVGLAAACAFALTRVSYYERFVLTDAFSVALFTIVTCHLAIAVYSGRHLTERDCFGTSAARSRWTGAMAAMITGASERANSGLASRISKQSDERLPCEFMLL